MRNFKRSLVTIAVLLALSCVVSLAVGCGANPDPLPTEAPAEKQQLPDIKPPEDKNKDKVPSYDDKGLLYELNEDGASYSVKLGNCTETNVVIPDTHKGKPVSKLGDFAFKGYTALKSIELPKSVTSIGVSAFEGCTGLARVSLPSELEAIDFKAFYECKSIVSIEIPDSVKSVAWGAFYGCTSLSSITIGESVENIGSSAFDGCVKLVEIINKSDLKLEKGSEAYAKLAYYALSIKESGSFDVVDKDGYLFITIDGVNLLVGYVGEQTDITLPNDYNGEPYAVGKNAFYGCTTIKSVKISTLPTSIGESAFAGCAALTKLYIDDLSAWCGVELANNEANPLYYAKNLYVGDEAVTSLVIPEGVTGISAYAFAGGSSFKSVTIPNSVSVIDESAFAGCTAIEEATMPTVALVCIPKDKLKTVTITAGDAIAAQAFKDATALKTIIIPNSVTDIGEGAFEGCTAIETATMPTNAISHIPQGKLKTVVLTGGTTISESAFKGCKTLVSIVIPESVSSIGSAVFADCTALESISVAEGNTKYHSADNCLIETATKTLIAGCKASVIPDDGSISSIGKSAFEGCTGLEEIAIPNGVTDIADSAFSGCTSLKDVTLPDSVSKIGASAFSGCILFTSIEIPKDATTIGEFAFSGCTSLESISVAEGNTKYHSAGNCIIETETKTLILGCKNTVIPADGSVTVIGAYAFENCKGIESIVIPDGVTEIGEYAFSGCTGMKNITIPNSVSKIAESAFEGCTAIEAATMPTSAIAYIPKNKLKTVVLTAGETIEENAFKDCKALKDITFPDGITAIASYAFVGCTGLEKLTIPATITDIGQGIFSGCTNLKSLAVAEGNTKYHSAGDCIIETETKTLIAACTKSAIPDDGSVTIIGASAFEGVALSSSTLTIPLHVTTISDRAFFECKNITRLEFANKEKEENHLRTIGASAFEGCTGIKTVILPSGVTSIGKSAFAGAVNMRSIALPSALTTIGASAFSGCNALSDVTFGSEEAESKIESIEESTFLNCKAIRSIKIPASVSSIAAHAFENCSALKSIEIPKNVNSIGELAFRGCVALESITVAEGNTKYRAIENCLIENGTKNLILGCKASKIPADAGIVAIAAYAFEGCTELEEIVIPEGVTTIGESAFASCEGLKKLSIASTVKSIGESAFEGCTAIEELTAPTIALSHISKSKLNSVKINGGGAISEKAFADCELLASVEIAETVSSIGSSAFEGCKKLEGIAIPRSVRTIGANAFKGCSALASVSFAQDSLLKSIGESAFASCSAVAKIEIPSGVTEIGSSAFDGCTGITEVYITNLSGWCKLSFANKEANPVYYAKKMYLNGNLLTALEVPKDVTSIGEYAFAYCRSITSIAIPSSVRSIGEWSFAACSGIESITVDTSNTKYRTKDNCLIDTAKKTLLLGCKNSKIPADGSVTAIANGAFYGCTGLTTVNISRYIVSIGETSFEGCTAIAEATLTTSAITYIPKNALRVVVITEGTNIPENAFSGCATLTTLTLPAGIESIGRAAFAACTGLTELYIADIAEWCKIEFANRESNPLYYAKNLYVDNTLVTELVIPEGVTSIGAHAFAAYSKLESVTISAGVTDIGYRAFYYCTSLKTINFGGTKAEWELVNKDSSWDYITEGYTLVCAD